jgi:hypothetical protein
MAKAGILLIALALVAGMANCIFVRYDLTTSSTEGGQVTTPGEATFTYGKGTVVNLMTEPEQGYRFVNWTGDVNTIANVNAAVTTITMNGYYLIYEMRNDRHTEGRAIQDPVAGLQAL